MIKIPVSIGELIDKITILEIKKKRICDVNKKQNVENELTTLQAYLSTIDIKKVKTKIKKLGEINQSLWDIEDKIRVKDKLNQFDQEFIDLARSVYITNDKRSEIKRQINILLNSELVEEKSYE